MSVPVAGVTSGTVTLSDGTAVTSAAVAGPHTSYRAWAVAAPDGGAIASVDEYGAAHRRLTHDARWR